MSSNKKVQTSSKLDQGVKTCPLFSKVEEAAQEVGGINIDSKNQVETKQFGIMEELLANQGLHVVVRHISSFLDVKSLARCRQVSKDFKRLIDSDRQWFLFQLEHIHTKKDDWLFPETTLKESYPEWITFIDQISGRIILPDLEKLTEQMWIYLKNEPRLHAGYLDNPFHHAIMKSNTLLVQMLIDYGFDLEMTNWMEESPLFIACENSSIEMVQLLIDNTHFPCKWKESTIFHAAVCNANTAVLKLILDKLEFEDVMNSDGKTVLHVAIKYGTKETIEYLIQSRHTLGINLEKRTKDGWSDIGYTILHLACKYRRIDIVEMVCDALSEINSYIDFDTSALDMDEELPYCLTFTNQDQDLPLELLKKFPSLVNVLDRGNRNYLHYACMTPPNNITLLQYIFKQSEFVMDFNVTDIWDNTPLHYACLYGHQEAMELLLDASTEYNIDINKKNWKHYTPEDLARQRCRKILFEPEKRKKIEELLAKWYHQN